MNNRKKVLILISFFLIILSSLSISCYAASGVTEDTEVQTEVTDTDTSTSTDSSVNTNPSGSSGYVTFESSIEYTENLNNYVIYDTYNDSNDTHNYYAVVFDNQIDVYNLDNSSSISTDLSDILEFCVKGYHSDSNTISDVSGHYKMYHYNGSSWTFRGLNYAGSYFSDTIDSIVYSTVDIKSGTHYTASNGFVTQTYSSDVFFSRTLSPQAIFSYRTVTSDSLYSVLNGIRQLIPIVLPVVIAIVAFYLGYRLLVKTLRTC